MGCLVCDDLVGPAARSAKAGARNADPFHQGPRADTVVAVPWCHRDREQAAFAVTGEVDFGGSPFFELVPVRTVRAMVRQPHGGHAGNVLAARRIRAYTLKRLECPCRMSARDCPQYQGPVAEIWPPCWPQPAPPGRPPRPSTRRPGLGNPYPISPRMPRSVRRSRTPAQAERGPPPANTDLAPADSDRPDRRIGLHRLLRRPAA